MKTSKILLLFISFFILINSINFIYSEVYLYDTVIRDNSTSTVNFHAFYVFQDTSVTGKGAGQEIPLTFWYQVEALPINISIALGDVDWCNFTIKHYRNSSLLETFNSYFENSPANNSKIVVLMKDRDSLTADMKCHYTNLDGIYAGNSLAGDFNLYMPSLQCTQCIDYSLEQLSDATARNENITRDSMGIYSSIQKVVNFNFQIWLIISWVLKIGFIFIALGLVFAGVYYFYVFFSNIGKELNR
jgi:hypothetical protein